MLSKQVMIKSHVKTLARFRTCGDEETVAYADIILHYYINYFQKISSTKIKKIGKLVSTIQLKRH